QPGDPQAPYASPVKPRPGEPGPPKPALAQPRVDKPRADKPRVDKPRVDKPRVDERRLCQRGANRPAGSDPPVTRIGLGRPGCGHADRVPGAGPPENVAAWRGHQDLDSAGPEVDAEDGRFGGKGGSSLRVVLGVTVHVPIVHRQIILRKVT